MRYILLFLSCQFVITVYADGTVSVREPPRTNSGHMASLAVLYQLP